MEKKKELTFKGGSMLGRERRLLALVAAGAAHLSPAIATNPAAQPARLLLPWGAARPSLTCGRQSRTAGAHAPRPPRCARPRAPPARPPCASRTPRASHTPRTPPAPRCVTRGGLFPRARVWPCWGLRRVRDEGMRLVRAPHSPAARE